MASKNTIKLGFDVNPEFKQNFTNRAKANGLTNVKYLSYLVDKDSESSSSNSSLTNAQLKQELVTCKINCQYLINNLNSNNIQAAIQQAEELNNRICNLL